MPKKGRNLSTEHTTTKKKRRLQTHEHHRQAARPEGEEAGSEGDTVTATGKGGTHDSVKDASTLTGTALPWNEARGFGFIKPNGGGENLFCHASDILDGDSLQSGSVVQYHRVYNSRKAKYCAVRVTGSVRHVGQPKSVRESDTR